ncbi:MAG: tetratricopeptide repeat protein [Gammaproteobacteria bacterium]|nr:tetratricopeptide repeat protein [Gammaproteobacteria bacterium]
MRRTLASALVLLLQSASVLAVETPVKWGELKSPYLREALYDFAQNKYFSAIGHLLAERWRPALKPEKSKTELMLAYSYLAYGMHADAATVLQQLPQDALTDELRNQFLIELAMARYQRGDLLGTIKAAQKISGDMSTPLRHRKIGLDASVLLQQKQTDQALALLRTLKGDSEWAIFGYYNLGVILLRDGHRAEAETWLNKVGNNSYSDPESRALRDRANYILGFSALKAQAALQAKNYFQQVPLDSPFSNRALWGVGLTFQTLKEPKQALAAWLELAKRNAADRSVLDGLVAIPYVYAQLGAYDQSVKQYRIALETIQTEIKHVEAAIEQVRIGGMLNVIVDNITQAHSEAFNEYQNFPVGPESRYFAGLYESHTFQTALRNYRDLRLMEQQLQRWASAIYSMENASDTFKKVYVDQIAAKQTKLVTAAAEMKQYIGKLAMAELENRLARLRGYTTDALFKLGQMYDRESNR